MVGDGERLLKRFEAEVGRDILNSSKRAQIIVQETLAASALPLVRIILQFVKQGKWRIALISYGSRLLSLLHEFELEVAVSVDCRKKLGEERQRLTVTDLAKLQQDLEELGETPTVLLVDDLTALANDVAIRPTVTFISSLRQKHASLHLVGLLPSDISIPRPKGSMGLNLLQLLSFVPSTIMISLHAIEYLALIADFENTSLRNLVKIQQDVTTPIGGRLVQALSNKRIKHLSYSFLEYSYTLPHMAMECCSNSKAHHIERWRLCPLAPDQPMSRKYCSEIASLIDGLESVDTIKEQIQEGEVKIEVPFNLSLSESQKAARAQVQLPYLHTADDLNITYDPDSGDDFDDEEGIDDDLDI